MMKMLAGAGFAALALIVASQGLAQRGPTVVAPAIETTVVPCPTASALITIPEIASDRVHHRLRATLKVDDGARTFEGGSRCFSLPLRYFTGHTGLQPGPDDPAFAGSVILPGPTLRARIGDWVEIAFFNHVNPLDFGDTLDRGDHGDMRGHAMPGATPDPFTGCDLTYQGSLPSNPTAVPTSSLLQQSADKFPNCLHGSSTTNVHFHGTHTTPGTTGDNVLLFVRPANRIGNAFQPSDRTVSAAFGEFFAQCEKQGYPATWGQMPKSWRDAQFAAIDWYDRNTPYQGNPRALPTPMWLAPVNAREVAHGLWPQYQIGATPYCFPLPAFGLGGRYHMGQSPGTQWYHAHKHGSTALNVANGMTGAFIIEGPYDDALHGFYKTNPAWAFRDRVLMIQQLTPALNLSVPGGGPGSRQIPLLTVNGRHAPVVTLRRNQVELFRFINGAERDGAYFAYFRPRGGTPCSRPSTTPCMHWNQTAQDGVQLAPANYDPGNATGQGYQGAGQDAPFYLAPANRADLLVQAPDAPGTYELVVKTGLCRPYPAPPLCGVKAPREEVLLVVDVPSTNAISPGMPFVPVQSFPKLPSFLADIPRSEIYQRRTLVFEDNNGTLQINGKQFADSTINQTMQLNAVEEWTVENLDGGKFGKEHPFHIHINPFQIVEVFEPNDAATLNKLLPDGRPNPCYVDPANPETWRQCNRPQKDFVWWDTFAIPASRTATVPCAPSPNPNQCLPPPALRNKVVTCGQTSCSVTIPGYFKLRTRFVDFTGQYVLHCHILTHEDRGMMELIQVVADKTIYTHH